MNESMNIRKKKEMKKERTKKENKKERKREIFSRGYKILVLPSLVGVAGDEGLVHLDVMILQGVDGASFSPDELLQSLFELRLQSDKLIVVHRQPQRVLRVEQNS